MSADFRWLTTKEAAEYCRVSVQTFRRMAKRIPIKPARPAGPRSHPRFFRLHLDAALRSTIETTAA